MIGILARLGAWLTLPIGLAHELTHAIASLPWAREWWIGARGETVDLETQVQWEDDAPAWGIALAHLAPMLTGAGAALAAGLLILGGDVAPANGLEALGWAAAALAWAMYAWPSRADLHGALAALGDDKR